MRTLRSAGDASVHAWIGRPRCLPFTCHVCTRIAAQAGCMATHNTKTQVRVTCPGIPCLHRRCSCPNPPFTISHVINASLPARVCDSRARNHAHRLQASHTLAPSALCRPCHRLWPTMPPLHPLPPQSHTPSHAQGSCSRLRRRTTEEVSVPGQSSGTGTNKAVGRGCSFIGLNPPTPTP